MIPARASLTLLVTASLIVWGHSRILPERVGHCKQGSKRFSQSLVECHTEFRRENPCMRQDLSNLRGSCTVPAVSVKLRVKLY